MSADEMVYQQKMERLYICFFSGLHLKGQPLVVNRSRSPLQAMAMECVYAAS